MNLCTSLVILFLMTSTQRHGTFGKEVTNTIQKYLMEVTGNPNHFKILEAEINFFDIPKDCKELGHCDHIPETLEKYAAEVVKLLSYRNISLEDDEEPIPENYNSLIESEYEDLCPSKKTLYVPKAARDINNAWYIVLNDINKPKYKYRVEICKYENSSCSYVYFPPGSESKCLQKYMVRKVMAFNGQYELSESQLLIPCCCSCGVRKG